MREIEGKARRVQHYGRFFYWYASIGGLLFIGFAAYTAVDLGQSLAPVALAAIGGIALGAIFAIRFRDTP